MLFDTLIVEIYDLYYSGSSLWSTSLPLPFFAIARLILFALLTSLMWDMSLESFKIHSYIIYVVHTETVPVTAENLSTR